MLVITISLITYKIYFNNKSSKQLFQSIKRQDELCNLDLVTTPFSIYKDYYITTTNNDSYIVLKISRKEAKQYIEQYLSKYQGIKSFMDNIVETAKKEGYVETLFHRRRYVPEINSNNYMVRQFGNRIAMNTPIQGTAADIMKLAMINIYRELNKKNLKSKIILQVHDELLIEVIPEEKEEVKQILKQEMENVIKLKVPLKIDIEEGKNLYEAK